jgi:hypothetical protein
MDKSDTQINTDFDLFSIEEKYSFDLKDNNSTMRTFICDEENNLFCIYTYENTLVYFNESKNFKHKFKGLENGEVCSMLFISENEVSALVLLFEKGELFIIPCNFLESDFFEFQWDKILKSSRDSSQISESILYKPEISASFNFSDLLICSRHKSDESNSKKILTSSNFKIVYRNIFSSFLLATKNLPLQNNKMKNTSLVRWLSNDNMTDYLVMNVDFNILLINLNTLECVIIL